MRLSFPAWRYVLYPIEIFVIANVWLWINYGVFYVLVWKNKNYQNLLIFHAYEVKWKGMDVFYISYEQIYKLSHPKNVFFRCWLNRIICEIIFPLTPCILWCRLLSMACSTIISCMFNLMIVMCSPEIVSVFVHVFDLKFPPFQTFFITNWIRWIEIQFYFNISFIEILN